jgi:hypothetical protein
MIKVLKNKKKNKENKKRNKKKKKKKIKAFTFLLWSCEKTAAMF